MATYGKRRSERVLLDVPLIVRGQAVDKKPFRGETFTVTVSAHGALMLLSSRVELGQKLVLRKAKTAVECEANVTFLGPPYAGLSTVGVEFKRPRAKTAIRASSPARHSSALPCWSKAC